MTGRVLLISYYFPPLGLAGVSRPLALFKKLPEFGYDCHVLTVKPVLYRAYEPDLMEGLDVRKIHRSGSRDPHRLLYVAGIRRMRPETIKQTSPASRRFFPDAKAGWIKPAVHLGRTLIENYQYDWIISTSPPMSAHVIASKLHHEMRVKWLADFRDPWTMAPVEESFADARLVDRGRRLLNEIIGESDLSTGVSSDVSRIVGAGHIIRNGYDSEVAIGWEIPPPRVPFSIGVLGHFHERFVIEPLLKLLESLKSTNAELLGKIRIIQVGQVNESSFRALFAERGLGVMIDINGQLPRRETVAVLSEAHLLYLGVPEQERNSPVPLKTFDMLRSGRPVLVAASASSESWQIIQKSGRGIRLDDDSLSEVVSSVERIAREADDGTYRTVPPDNYVESFSDRDVARRFAELLESGA